MIRTATQNARLHFLTGQLNIDKEMKEDLVYQFTNGRETSSAKMDIRECQALINHLGSLNKENSDKGDKMRKKILSIVHELGWETPTGKIDWKRLNDYLNKYGYLHKHLNDYQYHELPKLVTQFENLQKTTLYGK